MWNTESIILADDNHSIYSSEKLKKILLSHSLFGATHSPVLIKNFFDIFFVFEQMLSLGDPPSFCDLPPAKPTFLLSST